MEIKLNVKNMVCHGCENRVNNVIKEIKGVNEVKASYTDESVIIKGKDFDLPLIISKIEDLGFDVIKEK